MSAPSRAVTRVGLPAASTREGKAFTLIELVVTVAIIVLLVSMLAPSLQRARESTYSAVCKSNMRQLWEVLQTSASRGDSVLVPAPEVWLPVVRERKLGGVLQCPKDSFLEHGATLADVVAVQYHHKKEYYPDEEEEVWEYPLEDMLSNLDMFQLKVTYPATDVMVFTWANHSVLQVTKGSEIELQSLMGRSRADCIAEMYIKHRGETVMRLTGEHYATIDPPYHMRGDEVSYAMNDRVGTVPARPDQLLLVEYEKAIAREEDDLDRWLGTGRHLGNRINIVTVDGGCRAVDDWELKPTYEGLWPR